VRVLPSLKRVRSQVALHLRLDLGRRKSCDVDESFAENARGLCVWLMGNGVVVLRSLASQFGESLRMAYGGSECVRIVI